jgi:hypothetical protein
MTSLHTRIKTLSDQQLAALAHSLRSPPRPDDIVRTIDAELASRHARKRDAAQVPERLQLIASRMTGFERIDEISEAQKVALLMHKPRSLAALRLKAAARGKPWPAPGNLERRRYVPPDPHGSPEKPEATGQNRPVEPTATAVAPPANQLPNNAAVASNVVPFACYGKFFGGRSEPVWPQGET